MNTKPAWKVRAAWAIMIIFLITVVLFFAGLAIFLIREGIEHPALGLVFVVLTAISVFAFLVGWAASVLGIEK